MKRTTIALSIVALAAAAVLGGCATSGKGMTDEEILGKLTEECIAAALAQDIDKLLTYYSDDFSHYEFGDKAGLKEFLDGAKDMGYLDGLEVSMEQAKTTIEGDTATIFPVILEGTFGSTEIEFTSKKEGDTWKVIGMDIAM